MGVRAYLGIVRECPRSIHFTLLKFPMRNIHINKKKFLKKKTIIEKKVQS